tara:strand:+ start:126 stop:536 length:411 start_codon:yes stop_codon:yes gene_type:complete
MDLFDQLGGITPVKQLANTFYDVMDTDPDFHDLRVLHPQKLITTKKKLFRFLRHRLTTPDLLIQDLRNDEQLELRHRHVELNKYHIELWLACMDKTMTTLEIPTHLKSALNIEFVSLIHAMKKHRETNSNPIKKGL